MAQIHRAIRQGLDDQQRRNAAREISECVRALDLAERKTAVGVTFHQRLARIIIGLDKVAPDLRALRADARKGDSMSTVLVAEYDVQCSERDRLIRRMVTDATLTDTRMTKLGLVKWARKVLREAKAKKVATARRRAARSGAKPKAKRTARPARKATPSPRVKFGGRAESRDADGLTVSDSLRRDEIVDRLIGARRR